MTQEFDYKRLLKAYIETVGNEEGISYSNRIKNCYPSISNEEIEEIMRIDRLPISNDEFDLTK